MPRLTAPRLTPPGLAWGLVVLLTAWRLWLSASVGLGDDEAYYWEWSRHLAVSYFDHPPVVAWLIAASTAVLGHTTLAVRLPFVLSGLVASAALWALARDLTDDRVAAWAVVAFNLCPLFGIATVFAAPDMPFIAAWLVAWWAVGRTDRGLGWWALVGLASGIGALCKYHAIFLPLGVLGVARARLRTPGPWLAAGLALALFSPVIAWNASHDWVSFAFHLSGRHHGAAVRPLDGLGTFLGSQLGFVSPVLAVAGAVAVFRARGLVLWASAPMLGLFAVQSLFSPFKAHWSAGAWAVLLIPVMAWPRLRPWALGVAGATLALVYVQAVRPILPLSARADVTNDLVGWDQVARRVTALGAHTVATHMYQNAAQLDFALRDTQVAVIRLGDRRDQYTVWGRDHVDGDAIFVTRNTYPLDLTTEAKHLGFASCEPAERLPVSRGGRVVRTFTLWRCHAG